MAEHNQNSVELVDGIIYMVQKGDQTFKSINQLNKKVEELSKGLPEVKILVDHREVGKTDLGARKAAFNVARHTRFDKMAFFGSSPYISGLVNLIARSVGKKHTVHFASTKEEALRWLK